MRLYRQKNLFTLLIILLITMLHASVYAEEENEESIDISELNQEQRQELGIEVSTVKKEQLVSQLIAPGEVRINIYHSSQISTRISAQIIKRYARMGDEVKTGQALINLSSVQMADAQGDLFIADKEWQRVKKLGRKVVSEQRYIKAQVTRQQAYAKVLAYGMTQSQVNTLLKSNNASNATGNFDLLSIQNGMVISDNFVPGQVVQPGDVLMEISDESRLWVQTRINPEDVARVKTGALADIFVTDREILKGKVIQIHHKIDEATRTLPVRIEVDNKRGLLHPGQFVKTALQVSTGKKVVAVPVSSVVLLQGNQVVFQLKNNRLDVQFVETGEVRDNWVEIKSGLKAGDQIVTKGMFLLKSFMLKSQIGDSD